MHSIPTFDSFPEQQPTTTTTIPSFDSFPELEPEREREREPERETETETETETNQADQFLNSLKQQIEQQQPTVPKKSKRKTHHHHQSDKDNRKREKKHSHPTPPAVLASNHQVRNQHGKLIFTLDLREDTFNLHHAKPDKAKVPRYRRAAAGQVLGIHPNFRITLASAYRGDGLQLTPQSRTKPISISDPAVLQLLKDKNLKRISLSKTSSSSKAAVNQDSFIPLLDSDRATRPPERPREINLLAEPESEEEDGLEEYRPPEDDGGESLLDRLNRRKNELERKTTQHPDHVEAWLALVSLQDEMKELGLVGLRARAAELDQTAISRHIQGTSDLKLSYLKRALQEPCNQDNEQLLLAYMKAYCDQPDLDLSKEWQQILEAHPALTGLWIAYVDWKQTEAGSMNVLEMVEVYEDLIDRLVRRSENPNTPVKERALFEQSIVYLFHRCCVMLKQAGYTERATAAFQAIMEVNFFRPNQHIESLNELVDDFEAFWDSEHPRIGEDGAKGWTNTDLKSAPPEPPPAHDSPDHTSTQLDHKNSTDIKFSSWQAQEMKAHLPLRTTDLQDDQDPFECVLFEDVRNLLFLLSTNDSLQALLYSFLSFVGVSIPPPDIDTNVPFFTDPFLSTELIDVPERQSTFWPQLDKKLSFDAYGPTERLSGIRNPQMIPFRIFPCDIRQLFADPSRWFVNFEPPHDSIALIRNSFRALKTTRILKQDTYFQLCELSFEARLDVASAIKLAKHSLSLDQHNLVLWDAYARLCLLHGKPKQARDVYVKTLEMSQSGPEALLSLWYSWAEMEFQLGHFRLVISILARAVNCLDESPSELVRNASQSRSPALLLRVRRAFTGQLAGSFQDDVPLSLLRTRVSAAVGFGTFQYVTEGYGAACEAYEGSIEALGRLGSGAESEELWLSYSRMIYAQMEEHGRYKPAEVRAVLQRAISQFPNNSVFLALFAFNESRMKIENHTRRLLHSTLLHNPARVSVNRWLLAVWAELHLNSCSYNLAAVRGLFERALSHQSARSSLQLWLLYIHLELLNANLHRARALVVRSLAHCPWAKELYLMPFSGAFLAQEGGAGEEEVGDLQGRMARLVDEKCVRIRDRSVLDTVLAPSRLLHPRPLSLA